MKVITTLAIILGISSCLSGSDPKDAAKKQFQQVLMKRINEQLKLHKIKISNLKDIDSNTYIDDVLLDFHQQAVNQGLDPYSVYDVDVLGVDLKGLIGGYSNLHRDGDAFVSESGDTLGITFNCNMVNLEGMFNWSTSFLGIDYNGDADAMVDIVEALATLSGPIVEGSDEVTLQCDSIDIESIGRITVEVHGFGIFDEIIDIITQAVVNLFSFIIPWFMNDIVKIILNDDVLPNYPFPLPETVAVHVM